MGGTDGRPDRGASPRAGSEWRARQQRGPAAALRPAVERERPGTVAAPLGGFDDDLADDPGYAETDDAPLARLAVLACPRAPPLVLTVGSAARERGRTRRRGIEEVVGDGDERAARLDDHAAEPARREIEMDGGSHGPTVANGRRPHGDARLTPSGGCCNVDG